MTPTPPTPPARPPGLPPVDPGKDRPRTCPKCRANLDDGVATTLEGHPSITADGPDGLCAYHRKYARGQQTEPWPGQDFPPDPVWPGVFELPVREEPTGG